MVTILIILWVAMLMLIIGSIVLLIRNETACTQRSRIINAIHLYCDANLYNRDAFYDGLSMYDRMESYDSTLYRFYDFGCTRILPEEDYMKIREYIRDRR